MKKHRLFLASLISWLLSSMVCPVDSLAQCPMENIAFKDGEMLNYDLYFQWNFVWVKCGSAHYSVKKDEYNGKSVLRADLLFKTSKKVDMFFVMRDTLVSYITHDLVPLYFRKGATEGKRYTVNEVWYTYPEGKTQLRQRYLNRHGEESFREHTSSECIYDMLSILSRARSYDTSNLKIGDRLHYSMATGYAIKQETLVYKGKEDWEANDGKTYRCLVFSLLDDEDPEKQKEMLRFYVTDDSRHTPIRIDFHLKFGTAKAYFKSR